MVFRFHIRTDRSRQRDDKRNRHKRFLSQKKRVPKRTKATFLGNQAEEIRVADERRQARKMYHLFRNLDNKSENLLGTNLSIEGNQITDTAVRLQRGAEHFRELLRDPPNEPVQPRDTAEQPLASVGTT